MVQVMAEKGIDVAFYNPRPLEEAIASFQPDMIVTMGCDEECPIVPGVVRMDWDLPDPANESIDLMKGVRDKIEKRVSGMLDDL